MYVTIWQRRLFTFKKIEWLDIIIIIIIIIIITIIIISELMKTWVDVL